MKKEETGEERGSERIWGPRRPWARAVQGRLDVPADAVRRPCTFPPPAASHSSFFSLDRSVSFPRAV